MKVKLTRTVVASAVAEDGELIIWDAIVPGLGLRVRPSGAKSWCVFYRSGHGRQARQRRPVIGKWPTVTIEGARAIARDMLSAVAAGDDPMAGRELRAPTVEDLAKRHLRDHSHSRNKPKSATENRRLWHSTILPAIGRYDVTAVTGEDIAKLHTALADTPYQANRALALLSKAFNLAEKWKWRPHNSNPCEGIERYRETPRHRYLTAAEAERLGAELLKWLEFDGTPRRAAVAILLLLYTGARLSEILTARWDRLNLEQGALWLDDSKTGAKEIVLSTPAIRLLQTLAEAPALGHDGEPTAFIFPSAKQAGPIKDLRRPWAAILSNAGIENLRLHDLRHSFASVALSYRAASLGQLGQLLGHRSPQTTHRYAHAVRDPLRAAADGTGAQLDSMLGFQKPAEVVPFDPKKRGA